MPKGPLVTAEERNAMLRLSLAGKSRTEIAKELNRSKSLVTKCLGKKSPVGFQKGNQHHAGYKNKEFVETTDDTPSGSAE
jgi:IS30 family transposase